MIRINLLPVRAARKKENVRRQLCVFSLSVFFALGVMTYIAIHLDGTISDLDVKIENAQQELRRYQAIVKQVKKIKKQLKTLEAKMKVIEMLEANRSGPARIMDALTSLVVANKMWLTSMTQTGGMMNLEGVATDNKTVADFMKRLEVSPSFQKVDLIASKQTTIDQNRKFKRFTITCQPTSSKPSEKSKT
ncbi:MAG: hypothetical protein BA872_09515 [Desulfobacterales bacterium C00003060]|nr:MAG: hypothetical protein BA861_12065 [Desulfobacterales bacterium S3730MH5]OEU79178.1 MAG: hypothetical protein BA872_09515 [Desulfobacterales bacterium C00003060]OEU81008.1 MAG: hypothetical protein BA865_16005 [Desulfobacterales bacterium S5133MH4]